MEELYQSIVSECSESAKANATLKAIRSRYGTFYERLQYITFDALEEKDWPNNIGNNSVYIIFKVDLIDKKMEIHSCGHVWISSADKEKYSRDKYKAMHSMIEIAKRNGVKPMRKQGFKDAKDFARKAVKAYNDIMEQVLDYTNGIYPYKNGVKALKSDR